MSVDDQGYIFIPKAKMVVDDIGDFFRPQSRYIDLRFDDGTHSGVRLLRGTSIIEVQRKGVKKLFDLAEYEPVESRE